MVTTAASKQKTLLLVDDDRLVLVTLAQGLSDLGYKISTASSADDAEAFLAGGERPDLAILDVNMPGNSGLYLAERLRSFDHIPFIFLSAYSDPAFVEQAAEHGALGYLIKPIDSPQLAPSIEAALARAAELTRLKNSEHDLQTALNSERLISAAVGITMMQFQLGYRAAFEQLRNAARSQRRKLAEVAAEVVAAAETLNLKPENPKNLIF
jgi:AmiR/NasT family two-component response regulator